MIKINKFSPGMHIPIVDYKYFKKSKYKNIFCLPGIIKKEILKKERYRRNCKWFFLISIKKVLITGGGSRFAISLKKSLRVKI